MSYKWFMINLNHAHNRRPSLKYKWHSRIIIHGSILILKTHADEVIKGSKLLIKKSPMNNKKYIYISWWKSGLHKNPSSSQMADGHLSLSLSNHFHCKLAPQCKHFKKSTLYQPYFKYRIVWKLNGLAYLYFHFLFSFVPQACSKHHTTAMPN